ncbi:MAG: 3-deoxy-8-phosphooctulonate synthase [Candidatus Eisenbacteria bacterium]|uniref:3-deoxy-8-phosphooctulonate synthase n=1 Tax=Eiseniibacteriota bacterium TaxID=2212470 RepID=A0A9D6L8V6_UNCEI|nr:3-deoxy-8-phosphooctulonate synthase [Candidatus Eisenbacteria bacterium]MBI3539080.1 3-deoxy-8-phosphooctulonate synthase [Candidatus Eisenbacteria bacterium]
MKRFAIGAALQAVNVAAAEVGGPRLLVIAGPCVIESAAMALEIASHLKGACAARDLPFVFKASYRKANRSSGRAFAGLPVGEALAALARVRREVQVPVLTDVHEVDEVAAAAEVADVLQIPAFLSRQTALLEAAARTGRAVNVKKGQFLAPEDMAYAAEKLTAAGCERVLLTERGTTFGYHDLVVDMRALVAMRELGWPVVYDATHVLQKPGGPETGGDRRFAFPLMRAAVACGVDGLFFETHPDPAHAKSDAGTQLPLAQTEAFLDEARRVRDAVSERAHA